jgi:hypothetical protein
MGLRAWWIKRLIRKNFDKEMLSDLMGDEATDGNAFDQKLEKILAAEVPLDIRDNGIRLPDGFSDTLSELSEKQETANRSS